MAAHDSSGVGNLLELLTLQQVAERLNIPERSLRHWRVQGTGPKSARIGRRVMYRRVDVERWIDEQFADDGLA